MRLVDVPVVGTAALEVDPMVLRLVIAVEVPFYRSVHHIQAVREVAVVHLGKVLRITKSHIG